MKKYIKKIDFRCPDGIYTWYQEFAKLKGINISELLRRLPEMYDKLEGMDEPYVIIKVGYEGIEKLVYLTHNPDGAIGVRKRAIEIEIAEMIIRSKKTKTPIMFTEEEISNRFCIQKWNGKRFDCVCKELGIEIDEMVWY